MIASRIGLLVVTALALVLAVIVAVDVGRDRAPPSRELAGGLDVTRITQLAWRRAGAPAIVVERAGDGWRWTQPVAGIPANPSTIDAAIAALRGGRWQRRAAAGQAGVARATMTVTAGGRTIEIGVGAPLAGSGQTWLVIDGAAYLVDDWIATAFAPEPLALRETRPLHAALAAERIVVEGSGQTLRLEGARMVKPRTLWVAVPPLRELQRALAELELVAIGQPPGTPPRLVISVDGPPLATVEIHDRGCASGQVAIAGSAGPGCVEQAGVDAIERAVAKLVGPPAAIADPRPVPFEPIAVTLADGSVLDLEKRPRIGDRDADPGGVAELIAVLQAPLATVDAGAPPPPTAVLAATDRAGGKLELELLPGHRVRRRGEPVALAAGEGAWRILARGGAAYRDARLWSEEPSTIRSVTIEGGLLMRAPVTYTRGAVIGEWTRAGEGRDDDAAVEALVEQIAQLRGGGAIGALAGGQRYTLAFEVVPPGGTPVKRTFELRTRPCEVRIPGEPGTGVDPRICELVARLRRP